MKNWEISREGFTILCKCWWGAKIQKNSWHLQFDICKNIRFFAVTHFPFYMCDISMFIHMLYLFHFLKEKPKWKFQLNIISNHKYTSSVKISSKIQNNFSATFCSLSLWAFACNSIEFRGRLAFILQENL